MKLYAYHTVLSGKSGKGIVDKLVKLEENLQVKNSFPQFYI